MPITKRTSNYLYDYVLELYAYYRGRKDPETGNATKPVILLGGGSRSGKTETVAQVILAFMEHFSHPDSRNPKKLAINVYRDTSVDSRKTFKDFIKAYDRMGLLPMEQRRDPKTGVISMSGDYETVEQPKPIIRYKGNTIEFMGMPEGNREAVGCDLAFVNEILENDNKHAFDSIVRRTEIMTLADWNPSLSVHYIYSIKRYNFHYPVTTYLDNKWLPTGQKADAEAQCPWDFSECEYYLESSDGKGNLKKYKLPDDFTLDKWYAGYYQSDECENKFNGFLRRRWLKPERPENCRDEDYHKYRSVNKLNYENGTINRSKWLTYGEGVPSGQDGMVFDDITWIKDFPSELDNVYFGLDFGYSSDPSCLTRCGNIGMNMYIEKLCYQRTGTSDLLFDLIEKPLKMEEKRRYIEANSEKWYNRLAELRFLRREIYAKVHSNDEERENALGEIESTLNQHIESGVEIASMIIVCDTADIYKGRGNSQEQQFVHDLNVKSNQHGYGWQFIKVGSKPIVAGISLMKKFKLHLVDDKDVRTEQENYVFVKDDAGNLTNLPDKYSKFNHFWDSARYCIWKMFKWVVVD